MLVADSCAWHLSGHLRLEECAERSIFLEFIHEVNRYYRATSRFTHSSPTGHVSSMALAAFWGVYAISLSGNTFGATELPAVVTIVAKLPRRRPPYARAPFFRTRDRCPYRFFRLRDSGGRQRKECKRHDLG